jgi:hypothetical protein
MGEGALPAIIGLVTLIEGPFKEGSFNTSKPHPRRGLSCFPAAMVEKRGHNYRKAFD